MRSPDIVYESLSHSSQSAVDRDVERASLIDDADNDSMERVPQSINQSINQSVLNRWSNTIKVILLSLLISALTTAILFWHVKEILHRSFNQSLNQSMNQSTSQSINQLIVREDAYDRAFNQWRNYCESHNQVLSRNDKHFGRTSGDDGLRRVWSMNNQSINYIDHSRNPSLPACQSTDQILDSLKFGTRVDLSQLHEFITNHSNQLGNQSINQLIDSSINEIFNQSISDMRNQTELHSSLFLPSHCTINWLDSQSTCSVLSKYSHVTVIGDSMSRHFVQTLYATMTEDWRMGGLPLLSPQTPLYDSCQCDGMYSEHEVCRSFSADHIFHSKDLRSYGVCYDAIDADHRPTIFDHYSSYGPHNIGERNYSYLCKPSDSRPRFIHLQGIWHYENADPEKVISIYVDPFISTFQSVSDACEKPFTFHVLFTGGHAQSRWLDERYPRQGRARMIENNAVLKTHVEKRWNQKFIDFWNLTRDAPSSDGLHHLTEVNMLKVQYVLNHMDMLVE